MGVRVRVGFKDSVGVQSQQKFYCLRQCTSKRGCQSVGQKHTLWVFCQWQTWVQAVGRTTDRRIGGGLLVMHAAVDLSVGGSNPGAADTAVSPPPASTHQDSNRRPKNHQLVGCFTIQPGVNVTQMCDPLLGAFSVKTFDPPPPPSKKCHPVLGDRGLRIKKSIGGWSYWAKK